MEIQVGRCEYERELVGYQLKEDSNEGVLNLLPLASHTTNHKSRSQPEDFTDTIF